MKIISLYLMPLFFIACNAGTGKTNASDSPNATEHLRNTGGTGVDSSGNMSGSSLIAVNDCLTCHKIDGQSTGPSYRQIANKYEMNQGNIENLADRIIKGGKGLWGQNAMTPHSNLAEPKAEEMVKYILSLRNQPDTIK
jgi:cytochrome c